MTNYRAILDYYYKGNTTSQIARICECSRTTVLKTIKRAKECGIELPIGIRMNDYELLAVLYPKRLRREGYTQPDFKAIDKDKIKRKLTKYVAWRRYYKRTIAAGGKPYKKSQFFKLYKLYFKRYDYKGIVEEYATVDWSKKKDTRAKMRMQIKRLLKKYNYPPDYTEEAITRVVDQAEFMM